MERKPNRLINEKSPYLLQHAYNPVDWYPWCDEAFERAKLEDKPIFLSIGYSTCHWCHVMEKESFEDEEVAKILNNIFICIKVDREERPDIDAFYMDVCNILIGRGGWPLNIFMTSEKEPFYAGTYLPKESYGSLIGIKELAKAIDYYWKNKRQELLKSSKEIINIMNSFNYESGEQLNNNIFKENFYILLSNFDEEYGGFGTSPKFPPYNNLFFLIKYYQITKDKKAIDIVEKTLNSIRSGGIFDFVGGGIHRYSTDRFWRVPHFEKMLYDQALISILYTKAYLILKKEILLDSAKKILDYCIEYLKNDEGGFFCGEDADSEGVEGKFYQWQEEELKKIFTEEEFIEFSKIFNISNEGNFRDETTDEYNGKNILYMTQNWFVRYSKDNIFNMRIDEMLKKLKLKRDQRIRPKKDDKILFDWNCLMVISLLYLYKVTEDVKYKNEAINTLDFLEKKLIDDNFNLSHSYFHGSKSNYSFLEDYSYLIWCYLDAYQTFFEDKWLEKAIFFNDRVIEKFWDYDKGGFFHAPEYFREIPVRQKLVVDSVMPSGNSASLFNLLRLYKFTGKIEYFNFAKKIIETFSKIIKEAPLAYNFFINALSIYFDYPGKISVLLKKNFKKQSTFQLLKELSILDWVVELKKDEKIDSEVLIDVCFDNKCLISFRDEEELLSYFRKS